ncbi:MAG: hypothetical protein CL454_00015 [Acidimicrobiaceae bacterium]|nr:hypothetical protein [Acidimicrobiaceae bacterium]
MAYLLTGQLPTGGLFRGVLGEITQGLPCALPSAPHVPALCPIAPAFDRALGGGETCSMGGDMARGVPPKKAQLAALRPFRPPGRPPQPDHRGRGVGKNQ